MASGYIICLAYLGGLLLSGLPYGWGYGLGLGTLAAIALPRYWRYSPPRSLLLLSTGVAIAASAYLHLRTPAPTLHDVSHWVSSDAELSCVSGTLSTSPQLTRRGQLKAQLSAAQIEISGAEQAASVDEADEGADVSGALGADLSELSQPQPRQLQQTLSDPVAVKGRLYLTLPLLQGTGLYPKQSVRACGRLYAPRPAQNPSGFDFAAYLARQGIFAGLQANTVASVGPSHPPLLWQLRQRVVRAFVEPLGSPKGLLLSAMVLGRRAVDLPYDVRDPFSQAGLAHTLAASGFHVSLLLGLFLTATRRLSASARLGLGVGLLGGYAGLTGLQPSICRAVFMGLAVLLGDTLERQTRPVGLLLAAAVLILLVYPVWIWDLGFQLSFLATLGLLVTTQPLTERLTWLPTPIATALAVPVAAIAWTLPIQLWAFSTLSPYSLPLNVLMTPLISLISLVGMVDGAIALVLPSLASSVAQLLSLPIGLLMAGVTFATQLPGQTLALSQSLLQVGLIYGAFAGMSIARARQRLILGVAVVGLLLVPSWWMQRHLVQVTVLAGRSPAVVVQEQGKVGVIVDGAAPDLSFGLIPFLRHQSVNRIDWAIDTSAAALDNGPDGLAGLGIKQRYGWAEGPAASGLNQGAERWRVGDVKTFGTSAVRLRSTSPVVLDLTVADQRWRVVYGRTASQADAGTPSPQGQPIGDKSAAEAASPEATSPEATSPEAGLPEDALSKAVLVWSGQALPPDWLAVPLEAAIASSEKIDSYAEAWLERQSIPVHAAGQAGAVQWRPGVEINALIEAEF
ncbi:MAG: ComEC/Rec2 family competence protein [Elainellaceae cyanobacterium]